jgi:hypothetical protein
MKKQSIFNGLAAVTLCLLFTSCNNAEETNADTNVTADATPINPVMDAATTTDTLKTIESNEANEKVEANEKEEKNDKDDKK